MLGDMPTVFWEHVFCGAPSVVADNVCLCAYGVGREDEICRRPVCFENPRSVASVCLKEQEDYGKHHETTD